MKTPKELMRENYPEFSKKLSELKTVFGDIKLTHVKADLFEFGKELSGVRINPEISNKISKHK